MDPRTADPDTVTQILTDPDSDLYPAAISVYCDRCGATATNQFLVSDQDSSAERFEIARDHLRGKGWSCTADGDFCCNCLAIKQRTAEPQSARAAILAELLDGELPDSDEYPATRARLERLIDDVLTEAAARLAALPTANDGQLIAADRATILAAVQGAS